MKKVTVLYSLFFVFLTLSAVSFAGGLRARRSAAATYYDTVPSRSCGVTTYYYLPAPRVITYTIDIDVTYTRSRTFTSDWYYSSPSRCYSR